MSEDNESAPIEGGAMLLFILFGGILASVLFFNYISNKEIQTNIFNSVNIIVELDVKKLDVVVENKSNHFFKDATIDCKYFASSGTLLDESELTIYEEFPRNISKPINGIVDLDIPNQARAVDCIIKKVIVIDG